MAHLITRLELGGAQQNTLYCCENHDRKKFEVVLIAGAGGLLDPQARALEPRLKLHLVAWLKHPVRPLADLAAVFRLSNLLKREKIDLVHTHSSKAGIVGRLAAYRAGIPVVIHTIHGWGFHSRQFPLLRWIYQALERLCASRTDVLIAVSDENRLRGLSAGIGSPDQYRVIHSGIEPKHFRVSPARAAVVRKGLGAAKRPCVLVLSNFKAQKNPRAVVEVAESLRREIPNALFLWAGDGAEREAVERRVRSKGLQENFRFLGWRADAPDLLAASDVLLLTSWFEGLPRVVLQAMAAGKPVVATAVSGTPEAVRHGTTGFLHDPRDVAGMAAHLSFLLRHPGTARKMGAAGKRLLKGSFQIREMLRQIEAVYGAALKAKGVLF